MFRVTAALLAAGLSVPAAAATITWDFTDPARPFSGSNATTITRTVDGQAVTIVGRLFTGSPGSLTTLSQLSTDATLRLTREGVGVTGGGSTIQVDTNNPAAREAFLITTTAPIAISALGLSEIDPNDTLAIYGVNGDDSLTLLGFDGLIGTDLDGDATFDNGVLTFNAALSPYDRFVFTTRQPGDQIFNGIGGQGYRLGSITATLSAAIPEPATWALMLGGFGLAGVALRRRNAYVVA
jgi:hypothetical protein